METPDDLLYHPEDTWARLEPNGLARVGVSDFAQDQLGEIVWIDLPDVGSTTTFGEPFGEIESTKTTADLHSPVTGEVVEVNVRLNFEPGLVNTDPYGDGWIILVRGELPAEGLLSGQNYRAALEA